MKELELATQVKILDKAVCNSLYANDLEKGMNSFIVLPVINR